MKVLYTERFRRAYRALPSDIQDQADQQLARLLENPRHPSLRLKKMEGRPDIWELRITRAYRATFHIEGETYLLRNVGSHDILRNP